MALRLAALTVLLLATFPGLAKTSGGGHATLGSVASAPRAGGSGATAGGGGSLRGMQGRNLRKAPKLDPERKVNEQDCSKPIDLLAGNLRCK